MKVIQLFATKNASTAEYSKPKKLSINLLVDRIILVVNEQ